MNKTFQNVLVGNNNSVKIAYCLDEISDESFFFFAATSDSISLFLKKLFLNRNENG